MKNKIDKSSFIIMMKFAAFVFFALIINIGALLSYLISAESLICALLIFLASITDFTLLFVIVVFIIFVIDDKIREYADKIYDEETK